MTDKPQHTEQSLKIGNIQLYWRDPETLECRHDLLTAPVKLDAAQLHRWLLRQMREQVK